MVAAQPPEVSDDSDDREDPDDGDDARVLVASLGGGWVAVGAESVEGVVRPAPVTPVGGTPRWVAGVAAVRGAVRAVVDARRLAGAAPDDGTAAWWVVVAHGGRSAAVAGLRVWRVARVGADDATGPEPAPAVPGLPAGGVARLAGDLGRGADALPPAARRLDVAALLDLVHDPTHQP